MNERPILFSAPMVRAVLDGTKTQTRRAVKPAIPDGDPPIAVGMYAPSVVLPSGEMDAGTEVFGAHGEEWGRKCPYGAPGERLWVRETLRIGRTHPRLDGGEYMVEYAADGAEHPDANWVWTRSVLPSIFMPRGMARLTLEITDVRVERVRDISDADIAAEGVTAEAVRSLYPQHAERDFTRYAPSELWALLWSAINGAESWDANPHVWVIAFRVLEVLR